jgi:preprotein translocase subunit SecY
MFSAFFNSFKIPELRAKIFFTLGIIALCRVCSNIPCPGIDSAALSAMFDDLNKQQGAGGIVNMIDMFSGGALRAFAIGALGIMPYISASIIMQLVTPVFPQLEKLKREGEAGQQKIIQWTRYMTLVICLVQGFFLAKGMENPGAMLGGAASANIVNNPGLSFQVMTMIILTCGTMILMWFGEKITDHGVGNGASLIITVNIIDRLPAAVQGMHRLLRQEGTGETSFTMIHVIILLGIFVLITAATVALTQGVRKVPIQYARTATGGGGGQGAAAQGSFLPLRVNFANVMPIIFASAILMFPPLVINAVGWEWLRYIGPLFTYGTTSYMAIYAMLIILFSFFWVANQFNPIQMADDLKRHGGYIPGIRPGKPTSDFLDRAMTRITTAGALFLCILSLLPMIAAKALSLPPVIADFFGGATLLIICGVIIDTLRQIESHLMMHHYDGFLQKGRLRRGRGSRVFG